MKKDPIVKSIKTGNLFTFENHKHGELPKDEYPYQFIYEEEEELKYEISNFKLERFYFKGTKELKEGYLYKQI